MPEVTQPRYRHQVWSTAGWPIDLQQLELLVTPARQYRGITLPPHCAFIVSGTKAHGYGNHVLTIETNGGRIQDGIEAAMTLAAALGIDAIPYADRPGLAEWSADRCRCGAPAEPKHPCPYAEEISGDDSPCNCCVGCANKCEQDI